MEFDRLGPYEVLDQLGEGGMGCVSKVRDPDTGEEFAMKWAFPSLSKEGLVSEERFRAEANRLRMLHHAGVPAILNYGEEDGLFYYTMPVLEGSTLLDLVRQSRATLKETGQAPSRMTTTCCVEMFLQILEIVEFAYQKGVYHRDLKTDNIMVDPHNVITLIDWGIAIDVGGHDGAKMTEDGDIAAYVENVAPERASGGMATVESEIYSLGVIFYQLLTLRLPFQRQTFTRYKKMREEEHLIHPSRRTVGRDVPEPLANICLRCLEVDPAERFHSFAELIEQVSSFIEEGKVL